MSNYIVKDSGVREEYASGMVRDTQQGKPNFALLILNGIPFDKQPLTELAMHMTRGAEKYGERNFEKASGPEEEERFKASALRHLIQFISGEEDEDHGSAVMFNILAIKGMKARGTSSG